MSSYKHIFDIVSRSISLLKENIGTEYETTLFINCCLGLLIIPQQESKRTKPLSLNATVSYDEWGIDFNMIKGDKASPYVDDIARHFRNSLSHSRFDIVECNPGNSIEKIHIRDYDSESDFKSDKPNFDLIFTIKEFKRFVLKYAEVIENKLINQ